MLIHTTVSPGFLFSSYSIILTTVVLRKASQQRRELTVQVATALEKVLADVSALEFHPVAQRHLAAELRAAEQLLDLENTVNGEQVMTAVRRSTESERPWQQNVLVAHALAAHHAAKQLLALERVANGSR